jgi:hypothetical protein
MVIGYDLSSVDHGYVSGARVLLVTPSIDSLHDRLHLVLNGEQFHITVAEIGPSFSMKFSSIQHSEDLHT